MALSGGGGVTYNRITIETPSYETYTETFATKRYIDLTGGSDSNNGLTNSTPWLTLAKAVATEFTPIINTTTDFDQEWIIAGSSQGADKIDINCFTGGRTTNGSKTNIGIRAWRESDGARPAGANITRPLLRSDTAFSTLTLVSGTIYKSNVIPAGNTDISQVLWKWGTGGQLDADGCWKSHIRLTGTGTLADAVIAANLVTAGDYTAYYKSDTREVFVNTNNCDTTAANWSWAFTASFESGSRITLSGCNVNCIDGIDTALGDRGIVIFDASTDGGKVRIYNCRAYEHRTHSIILSYSNYPVRNTIISGCEGFGLGTGSVGGTMFAIGGQAGGGTNDMFGVTVSNCKIFKYMLQNPGGTRSASADYISYYFGFQTSISSTNYVRQVLVKNCEGYDYPGKVSGLYSIICNNIRQYPPSDKSNIDTYAVIYRNCYFSMAGGIFDASATGNSAEKDHSYAFDNCRIYQTTSNIGNIAGSFGYRAAVLFDVPAGYLTNGYTYMGLFNSEWVINVQLGDTGALTQRVSGIAVKSDAAIGNYIFLTARNSTITVVSSANAQTNVFDQSSASTAGGVDKGLALDIQNCTVGYANPNGYAVSNNLMCFQDLPASGNNGRIFLNNNYVNVNLSSMSSSNATLANWRTNVDPYAKIYMGVAFPQTDKFATLTYTYAGISG